MSSMLGAGLLQPPKTGTSRWSKALPEVPGIDLDEIYDGYQDDPDLDPLSSQDKDLPRLPIVPPPPRTTSITHRKSWKPTLPALPPIDTSVGAPQSGPPLMMSIPRRPVGMQSSRVYQTAPSQQQQQPPSPSQSISSILSAYSKPDGESPTKPSNTAVGTSQPEGMNPHALHASSRRGLVISPSAELGDAQLLQTLQHVRPIASIHNDIPPPVPSKDAKRRMPTSSSASSSPVSASDLNTSSPTQPQIWRRRSLKTDRALDLPDLKLVNSHGSTAASASAPAPASVSQPAAPPVAQPMVQPVTQSTQPYLPPGVVKVSALTYQQPNANTISSNNAPSAPAPVQLPILDTVPVLNPDRDAFADSPTMGIGISKLDRLKEKLSPRLRHRKPSVDLSSESTGRPGAHRPPTPEYQKQDVKTPIIDAFVSPLSPASSPEPATEVSPDLPKDLPKPPHEEISNHGQDQLPARTVSLRNNSIETNPIFRKALPPRPTQKPSEITPIPQSAVVPEPTYQPMYEANVPLEQKLENVAETEAPEDMLSPLPGDIGSQPSPVADSTGSLAHHSAEIPAKFPPRGSSVRSNAPRAAEQLRYPPADQDPRLVPSESQGYLYRGRDGTLYPEMKVTQEPHVQAAYFPRQIEDVGPEYTIFRAVPLKESHLNCYQGHKTMNRRSNRNYPLSCQSCDKPDAEDRWVCTFCHLRICEMCFTTLNEHQRDLRQLVDILSHPVDYHFSKPEEAFPSEMYTGYSLTTLPSPAHLGNSF